MSATAGWYADPTDDAAVRWWDGERWTDTTRPAPRELVGASARVEAHAPAQVAEAPRPAAAPRHVMAARPAVIEPEVLPDADRSRPGSGPAPVVLRPEPTTPVDFMSAMGSVGASGDAARQPATSQFGAPLGIDKGVTAICQLSRNRFRIALVHLATVGADVDLGHGGDGPRKLAASGHPDNRETKRRWHSRFGSAVKAPAHHRFGATACLTGGRRGGRGNRPPGRRGARHRRD